MTDHDPAVDDDFDPEEYESQAEAPASPEELTSTTKNAVVSNDPPTLTVNVEMSRATEYAKEKKSISSFLKTALPDRAILEGDDGSFVVNPAWTQAVDQVAKGMLAVLEVAVARQHGLDVASDDEGTVRVLNLFGGATARPTAAPVTPGPFAAPAAVAPIAPAVAAPVAPVVAAPPVAPAPVAPAVVGAVPQGTFQQVAAVAPVAPAAPAPQQQGGARKSNNPNSWSNIGMVAQQQLAANVEAWVAAGFPMTHGYWNNFGGNSKFPGFKVGETQIYANTLLRSPLFGPHTKAYVQAQLPAGQSDFGD